MPLFRLYNVTNTDIETYQMTQCPRYIAISHTWSDQIFATGISSSFGGTAIRTLISERYPSIQHCWIDNFCIKQDDAADKAEQIPLMGDIYRNAQVVAIVLTTEFGYDQRQVDAVALTLQPVLEAWENETELTEDFVGYWRKGRGRERILLGMRGLARLTKASWGTRIWTLQEFILATNVIWIGTDLCPVVIDDLFFQALPTICNRLDLEECYPRTPKSEFEVLYSHFAGMANSRLGLLDRTRNMELLGNRRATVAVDEVYGIMAACGVEIKPITGESREEAWERWWEAAVGDGHVRWVLLPTITAHFDTDYAPEAKRRAGHCLLPEFPHRTERSVASCLDSVAPLGPVIVEKGTVTLSGRIVGSCTLLRKLGSLSRSKIGLFHRGITLCMFARGRWTTALQIVEAFGSTHYNRKQQLCLAQVLVDNYRKTASYVSRNLHLRVRFGMRSKYHYMVWEDFKKFQKERMNGLNHGTGFLARISSNTPPNSFLTVVIAAEDQPRLPFVALDFEASTEDKSRILMIAEMPPSTEQHSIGVSGSSLHKVGTTIPIPVECGREWSALPLEQISLGGSRCHICSQKGVDE
ncbi:HET domain protein [Pyrenochaeta sp. DS3sAY3a]|nr:HET domain protein [Pyrenochaeta sp. DS3sAY3a]